MQVNHKFEDTNVDFDYVTSPRFGHIRCLRSTRLIMRGEELFTDYDYDMESWVPRWYKRLYKATELSLKQDLDQRSLRLPMEEEIVFGFVDR